MEQDNERRERANEEEIWSWGAGTDGQLGTGRLEDEHLPQLLSLSLLNHLSSSISFLACGGAHVVALTSCGKVLSWGRGSSGQLGHGDETLNHCLQPKLVSFPNPCFITHVSAGWSHSGFISDSGRLFTCGDGSFGQLGHGDYKSYSSPVEVSYFDSKHVDQMACGMRHSIALLKGDSKTHVYGFGSCKRGQLGEVGDKMRSVSLPQAISGLENIEVVSISAGGDHSSALSADGNLYSWGKGFPGSQDTHVPQLISQPLQQIKQMSLGWNHAIVLTEGGEVLMIGGKHHGVLGDPEKMNSMSHSPDSPRSLLRRVPGLDGNKVKKIAAGAEHSVLVTGDETIKTWGWGEHGQLGLGNTRDQILPQDVNLGQKLSSDGAKWNVFCGSGFTYALKIRTHHHNIS